MKYFLQLLRLDKYLVMVYYETKDLQNLRSYQNNLFYSLKWTNSGVNFSKLDILKHIAGQTGHSTNALLSTGYILSRLVSYVVAVLSIPINFGLRVFTSFSVIKRRLSSTRLLPEVL